MYEDAASTKLIATHCACCNRPLRDAASVEAGVGPECRRKYGMEERQVAPNWTAARAALEPIGLAGLLGDQDDARAGANAIAHAFAVYLDAERRTALATACTALGYTTLGHRLAEVLAEIRVEQLDGELAVKAPYLEDGARVWHRAGARWDRDSKTWRLGQDRRKQLWSVLRTLYPGRLGLGPNGLFWVR